MKRKIITLEVETDATNKELQQYYRKGSEFYIHNKDTKVLFITQVQVNTMKKKDK